MGSDLVVVNSTLRKYAVNYAFTFGKMNGAGKSKFLKLRFKSPAS